MPQMTNILVKSDADGSDITLHPVRDVPFPHWRTNIPGVPIVGQRRLELMYETMKNGKVRVNFKVVNPIMEVIPSGAVSAAGTQAAAKVADEDSFSGTFFFSPRGSHATRAELVRMAAHILVGASASANAIVNPAVSTAESYIDATTSYPLPYALVNLLFPGN